LVWLGYFMEIACCMLILSWICWFRQFFLLFLDFFHVHERTTMHAWIMLQSCSFCPYSSPVLINWAIKPEKNTKNIMISSCTTLTSHIVIEVWREEGKDNTQCPATALKGKGKVIVLHCSHTISGGKIKRQWLARHNFKLNLLDWHGWNSLKMIFILILSHNLTIFILNQCLKNFISMKY